MKMTIAPRKYFSETALILPTARCAMLPPEELLSGREISKESKELLDSCHIYLICRRPRLSLDPENFHYGPISSGALIRRVGGVAENHPFSMRLENPDGGPVSVAPYPHRYLIARDKMGVETRRWPAAFIGNLAKLAANLNDFEVLYVGQSFGKGNRSAFDRLQNHQTLQKILAETHAEYPDDEIMIFMFEYRDVLTSTHMDGIGKDAEISGEEDVDHVIDIFMNPPSQGEIVSMAEAGLIWYFKPKYNIKLKNSKPSSELKLLSSCYNFDIAGLVVEINSEEVKSRLFSSTRNSGYHHIAQFDLHDSKKRRSFFSILDNSGDLTLLDISGPVY